MAFLFFTAVFVLLGWLVCEHDTFATVPAAGPHTTITSRLSSAPAGPVIQLPRRERRAHARAQSRSRSPPPVPDWARPGSLLSPPRQPFRHIPAGRHDTFLDVERTEVFGQMKRVFDPVLGWKWVAVRGGGELVLLPSLLAPASASASALAPAPALVVSPPPPVSSSPALVPAPVSAPAPPSPSVASLLAGIPSVPQGLPHIFPVEAPAPQPQFPFGMLLAASINVPSSLAMVLPSFSPSMPDPPAHEAAGQPQSDNVSGFAAPPPPPISLSFGVGSGPGAVAGSMPTPSLGGGFAPSAPAPSFGGFGVGFSFPPSFSSSKPASHRATSGKKGLRPRTTQAPEVDSFSVPRPPLSEEASFKHSLKYHPITSAGLVNDAHIMAARFQDICMNGLADINAYLPGSTLTSFEHNLGEKQNGLRFFALLLRWQLDTGLPQPAGGSVALNQLITVMARLDGLVTGFVADNGGRQAEFEGGDFPEWGRSWRFLVKHLWKERGGELRRQLPVAVFGQLEDLVGRNQAHWARFRPNPAGRDLKE